MELSSFVGGNCFKNLVVLSLGWLLFFTAFQSIGFVLTSINHRDGVGFTSLAFLYGGYVVACLFSTVPLKVLTCKWSMVLTFFFQLCFLVSNSFTSKAVIYIFSVICGISQAIMWTSLGPYLRWLTTKLDTAVFVVNDRNTFVSPSAIFSIFFTITSLSPILASVVTTIVLGSSDNSITSENVTGKIMENHPGNHSCGDDRPRSLEFQCGIDFCDSGEADFVTLKIPQITRYFLIATLCACMLLALAAITFFLDREKDVSSSRCKDVTQFCCFKSVSSIIFIITTRRFISVLLIAFYHGLQSAFMIGEITKAYIGCEHGVDKIGYFMMVFGFGSMLSSMIVGLSERSSGSSLLFHIACGLDVIAVFGMYGWDMRRYFIWNTILLCALWGLGDGLWKTTVNSYIATEFPDQADESFSALNLMIGMGMTFTYAYGNFVCMKIKIIVTGVICVLAIVLHNLVKDDKKQINHFSRNIDKYTR